MKFLITALAPQIDKICEDLDKEKEKSKKIQSSRRFKLASKMMGRGFSAQLILIIDYKRINKKQIELTVVTGADGWIKTDKLKKTIIQRAKGYGDNVKIKVI